MGHECPQKASPAGARSIAALVLAAGLLMAAWWVYDQIQSAGTAAALAPYEGAPLPSPSDAVDATLASVGGRLFKRRCSACHAITGEARSGPDLSGVTLRRELSWVRHMMLSPDSMTTHDPVAEALRRAYGIQMWVAISEVEARAVLEFLRQVDSAG